MHAPSPCASVGLSSTRASRAGWRASACITICINYIPLRFVALSLHLSPNSICFPYLYCMDFRERAAHPGTSVSRFACRNHFIT